MNNQNLKYSNINIARTIAIMKSIKRAAFPPGKISSEESGDLKDEAAQSKLGSIFNRQ